MKKIRFQRLISVAGEQFANIDNRIIKIMDAFEAGEITANRAIKIYRFELRPAFIVKGQRFYSLCAGREKCDPEFKGPENWLEYDLAKYDNYFFE